MSSGGPQSECAETEQTPANQGRSVPHMLSSSIADADRTPSPVGLSLTHVTDMRKFVVTFDENGNTIRSHQYVRTRHNNLRCFPRCSDPHSQSSFCGQALTGSISAQPPASGDQVTVIGGFRNSSHPLALSLGERWDHGSPENSNLLIGSCSSRGEGSWRFLFTPSRKWQYEAEDRMIASDLHYFTVYALNNSRCVASANSEPFHVLPVWTAEKEKESQRRTRARIKRRESLSRTTPNLAKPKSPSEGSQVSHKAVPHGSLDGHIAQNQNPMSSPYHLSHGPHRNLPSPLSRSSSGYQLSSGIQQHHDLWTRSMGTSAGRMHDGMNLHSGLVRPSSHPTPVPTPLHQVSPFLPRGQLNMPPHAYVPPYLQGVYVPTQPGMFNTQLLLQPSQQTQGNIFQLHEVNMNRPLVGIPGDYLLDSASFFQVNGPVRRTRSNHDPPGPPSEPMESPQAKKEKLQ